ncbi:MAG: hypothetical protein VX874_18090 [Pseudomonadota bacterium]|nr:hypothetical protein [Pseudomonadota bacterium]
MSHGTRRLVVHIGDIKTGSTAIQTTLARRALDVPGERWSYARFPYTLDHGYLAAVAERIDPERQNAAGRTVKAAGRLLRLNRTPTIILSAEHFANIGMRRLHTAVRSLGVSFTETRVVIYVRPHIGALNALLAELLKQGKYAGTYETFVERHLDGVTFMRKIGAFRRQFGDDLVVRPFVRSELRDGSVVSDFASVAFPGAEVKITEIEDQNAAASLRDLMRLKVLHGELEALGHSNRFFMGWALAQQITRDAPEGQVRLNMPRPLADKVLNARMKDARQFDRQFLNGKPIMAEALERERDACTENTVSIEPSDWLDADEINTLQGLARTVAASWGRTPAWHVRLYLSYVRQMMNA